MNDNSLTDKLYAQVMQVIKDAELLVDEPEVPGMEHITAEVGVLCDEINALPIEQRVAYADKFKELFDALTDLEVKLALKRDEIGKMLAGTENHKKATNAYVKSFHMDDQKK